MDGRLKPKILFLTLHRKDRSPGQRFRHEQYLNFIAQNGYKITYSNLLNAKQDKIFSTSENMMGKIGVGMFSLLKRIRDLARANRYDYIFIYRDAFFWGSWVEWIFKQSNAKLIFDFDDAIWLQDGNLNRSWFQRLKNPAKVAKIISHCDSVIAGNKFLGDYARKYNANVTIIPTTIDTKEYSETSNEKISEKICIGWSGSFSTLKHYETSIEVLKKIKDKYGDRIYFKVIGDENYKNGDLNLQGLPWKKETEIEDLREFDIGIMPLPDDEWSKGKCGLKGLQYMALGIPAIMSPIGVNQDIIKDGKNGFLALTLNEWVEKISLLIEDGNLRKRIGKAGRETVVKSYSIEANKDKWLRVFKSIN